MSIQTRAIPSSGEQLPVIGLGTWQTFDTGASESDTEQLSAVLLTLIEGGGSVVDSSPMYGRSEETVGNLSVQAEVNDKLFIATKVWCNGKEEGVRQMKQSMQRLRRDTLDLIQVHNLTDWRTHLPTLQQWKEAGTVRYTGITHYSEGAYDEIEQILQKETVDFLQINYSVDARNAEERLFPVAQERNVAIIINRPFQEGALLRRLSRHRVPEWASEFGCETWSELLLKFIISHPAVTCVIPATSSPYHMESNLRVGAQQPPDNGLREELARRIMEQL